LSPAYLKEVIPRDFDALHAAAGKEIAEYEAVEQELAGGHGGNEARTRAGLRPTPEYQALPVPLVHQIARYVGHWLVIIGVLVDRSERQCEWGFQHWQASGQRQLHALGPRASREWH